MALPVRGSATPGRCGFSSPKEKPFTAALNFSSGVLARLMRRKRCCSARLYTMGTSLVVSEPPAMPASICPQAILLATTMAASRPVPQARASVRPGVVGARPEDNVASRARFQSDE